MLEKASILAIWRCQHRAVLAGIPTFGKASISAIWQRRKGKSIPNAAFWHSHNGKSTLEHQKSALTAALKVQIKTCKAIIQIAII
jgi:hypothetical protein